MQDALGAAYITSSTSSGNYPVTPGAAQETYGGGTSTCIVTKLTPNGSELGISGPVRSILELNRLTINGIRPTVVYAAIHQGKRRNDGRAVPHCA